MAAGRVAGLVAGTLAGLCVVAARGGDREVYFTNFDGAERGVGQWENVGASVLPVEGYAGLGPVGNSFGGNFLRYNAQTIQPTTLTVQGLPAHTALNVGMLLGVIDSWDGVELMTISVDGTSVFANTFQLATGDSSSYVAPPGALLSSGTELAGTAGSYYARDRAYDLSADPAFRDIPHTASSVTVTWTIIATSGSAAQDWQGGGDESWAIDNVRVAVVGIPGDANWDGRLDGDDYALIDRGFAKHLTGWSNGDFDNNGVVDAQDYAIINTEYARRQGGGLLGVVPEPGIGGMAGAGVAACALRRRRASANRQWTAAD